MEKIIDKITYYTMSSCIFIIAIALIIGIINNFRVVFNITLIIIAFLLFGAVIYETVTYLCKKFK